MYPHEECCDVMLCGYGKNQHFRGMYHLHHQDDKNQHSMFWLLVTAKIVPSSPILVTLMMETIHSPKHRFLQEAHGVASQKTAFFLVTAMKTSDLT
jgi:hypothetical protein